MKAKANRLMSGFFVCNKKVWYQFMTFKKGSFKEFTEYIEKNEKKIICYGAGMLPYYIEPLLHSSGIVDRVCLFLDGDLRKKGQLLYFAGREIRIESLEYLANLDANQYSILITAEKYQEIQKSLASAELSDSWECYAYPILNLNDFNSVERKNIFESGNIQIPKIIHYTWFGRQQKSTLQEKCIESWHRFCPDFEIREWNEGNYPVYKNLYTTQAYENRKWAYVSDYARLDILYQIGGVYLDIDVELFRSIEPLLNSTAFLCFGEWPVPNSGAGIGCIKGLSLMKELMDTRENIAFIQEDGRFDSHTNSNYEMQVLMKRGFCMDATFQQRDGVTLYPPDIIAPASVAGKRAFVTERTLGMHYCLNTWREVRE